MTRHFLLNLALFLVPLVISTSVMKPFELPQWLLSGAILGGLCVAECFSNKSSRVPAIPRLGVVIAAAIVIGQLIGIFTYNPRVLADYAYYVFVLVGYVYFFYNDIQGSGFYVVNHYARSLIAGSIVVSFVGFSQIFGYPFLHDFFGLMDGEGVAGTLGNINYTGQYLGICVLFFIFGLANSQTKAYKGFYFFAIVLALTYFSFLNTRSVIVGLGLTLAMFIWRGELLTRKVFLQLAMTTAMAVIVTHSIGQIVSATQARAIVGAARQESVSIRLDLWRATLKMIIDHPFGVGVGNFNFPFVPYRQWASVAIRDSEMILSPHNEFLSITAQSGIPVAGLIFFGVAWLLLKLYRAKSFAASHPGITAFLWGLVILFFIESMFQFPFDGQWVVVAFAFLVAGIFSAVESPVAVPSKVARPIFLGLAICCFYSSYIWYQAHLKAFRAVSLEDSKWACETRPHDWILCGKYANLLHFVRDRSGVENLLKGELQRQPNNWFAVGMLGKVAIDSGDFPKGCEYLRRVDKMFNYKSRSHDFIIRNC